MISLVIIIFLIIAAENRLFILLPAGMVWGVTIYILGPTQKPPYPSTLIWSNIFATGWKRD